MADKYKLEYPPGIPAGTIVVERVGGRMTTTITVVVNTLGEPNLREILSAMLSAVRAVERVAGMEGGCDGGD